MKPKYPYTRLSTCMGKISEFVGSPPSAYWLGINWSVFCIEEQMKLKPEKRNQIHLEHCFNYAIWSLQMIRYLGSETHWNLEDYFEYAENPKDYWERNGVKF